MRISPDVGARLAQFTKVPIDVDLGSLSPEERAVLVHLVRASCVTDEIFLRQAFADNPAIRQDLAKDATELGALALALFDLSAGSWDRLSQEPFLGDAARPLGAGFYPTDLSREEFLRFVEQHPEQADALRGLYTLVQRSTEGLSAIPYSTAFRPFLERIAKDLTLAAEKTSNASLARYLRAVIQAMFADDYYDSDLAWMDMQSRVEITLGPYETYEDRLFGYKSSFESFVTITDPVESEKLARLKLELPNMEQNLPIPDALKNPRRGSDSPIRIVDLVFSAGETRAGVQTIAFNLPNDERVREAKGSKNVLLRNVMNAKFEGILTPIAKRLLAPREIENIAAEAFFHHTLLHELSHGLGPGRISKDGVETEVRLALAEKHSAIEEAKADVMGIYNILYLVERGILNAELRETLFSTYLAGLFRATRFGIEEAHGASNALQFHFLLERNIIRFDASQGRYSIDDEQMPTAIRELLSRILLIQAHGAREGAEQLLSRYAIMSETLRLALEKVQGIPVDIAPLYPAAETLLSQRPE